MRHLRAINKCLKEIRVQWHLSIYHNKNKQCYVEYMCYDPKGENDNRPKNEHNTWGGAVYGSESNFKRSIILNSLFFFGVLLGTQPN